MNMCEPLKNKEKHVICDTWPNEGERILFHDWEANDVLKVGQNMFVFDKSDVKSAVEFYKKYRYKLVRDDVEGKLDEIYLKYMDITNNPKNWNDWLFDYCFGDVIERRIR